METLNQLDIKEEGEDLGSEEMILRSSTLEEFWRVAKLNDSLLFQKSRDKWIKEGDENTKYFHNLVNWRRRKNTLKGLDIQGNWVEESAAVKSKVREFF